VSRRRAEVRFVGVDGCASGWVAVELGAGGGFVGAWPASTLATLLADVPGDSAIGVDIPLGLVDAGWRTADRRAASVLGARRSSVFAVPPRAVWAAADHAEANRLCRALSGGGLSAQAWGLRRKVLEADAYREAGAHEILEVHPEMVFSALGDGPVPYGKKTWNGQATRRELLAEVGVVLPDDLAAAAAVAPDDVLDAAAVAWCAYRMSRGAAAHVPDPPDQYDHHGRPIVIWF